MARTAIVSHDVQAIEGSEGPNPFSKLRRHGGVGVFVTQLARLLTEQGEDVTIIFATAHAVPVRLAEEWKERYRQWGIRVVEVHNPLAALPQWQNAWAALLSERVAPLLDAYDVVYLADWGNSGFHAIRQKRFSAERRPVLVTVLHGPSEWMTAANQAYPEIPHGLQTEYIERYSARHSDYVIAPSRYLLNWLRRRGWRFNSEPQVLGLPYRPEAAGLGRSGAARTLRRIIFFGRIEPCKGGALLVEALRLVGDLPGLEEVVLLGPEVENQPGGGARLQLELSALGIPAVHIGNLDSLGAGEYLAEHVEDSLVVIPSRMENFPLAVIETSLIEGLNVVVSRAGGTSEVLGERAEAQYFDPTPAALAARIRERFLQPLAPGELARYDYEPRNELWREFHREALAAASGARPVRVVAGQPLPASVDVCIPYFNKPRHFPQTLEAFARQTVAGFGLIAVDDGSTRPEATAVFEAMAAQYRDRGWIFFGQPNQHVEAARNRLAERSRADYLCFLDADDVPAPNLIERMLEAALQSGDDCILVGGYLIEGEGDPLNGQAQILARNLTLGPDLVSGLMEPSCFGMSAILIRRSVFEAVGGYRESSGTVSAGHEDWELQARLQFEGYRTDVLPECLLYFRQLPDGLSRTNAEFPAKERLLGAYEEYLARIGLQGLARTAYSLRLRCQELEETLQKQVLESRSRRERRAAQMIALHAAALPPGTEGD